MSLEGSVRVFVSAAQHKPVAVRTMSVVDPGKLPSCHQLPAPLFLPLQGHVRLSRTSVLCSPTSLSRTTKAPGSFKPSSNLSVCCVEHRPSVFCTTATWLSRAEANGIIILDDVSARECKWAVNYDSSWLQTVTLITFSRKSGY